MNKSKFRVVLYFCMVLFFILGNVQIARALQELPDFTKHMGYCLFWYLCSTGSYLILFRNIGENDK